MAEPQPGGRIHPDGGPEPFYGPYPWEQPDADPVGAVRAAAERARADYGRGHTATEADWADALAERGIMIGIDVAQPEGQAGTMVVVEADLPRRPRFSRLGRLAGSTLRGFAWLAFPPFGWYLSRQARARRRHNELIRATRPVNMRMVRLDPTGAPIPGTTTETTVQVAPGQTRLRGQCVPPMSEAPEATLHVTFTDPTEP